MNIAKLIDGQLVVADYREMFKETSFPVGGPNDDFFTENNCFKVSVFKEHDRATQMLVGCGCGLYSRSADQTTSRDNYD